MNYYDELEVSTKASFEVIKAAYKAQAKQYHPDVYRGDPRFSSEKLKNLNNAYEVLIDPQKRSEYDYLNKIEKQSKPSSNTSEAPKSNTNQSTNSSNTNNSNYEESKEDEDEYYTNSEANQIILKYIGIGFLVFLIIFIIKII